MNFIPDVRYDFQTPNIVTLAVKVVTLLLPLPPSPLRFHWIRLQRSAAQGKVGLLPACTSAF